MSYDPSGVDPPPDPSPDERDLDAAAIRERAAKKRQLFEEWHTEEAEKLMRDQRAGK